VLRGSERCPSFDCATGSFSPRLPTFPRPSRHVYQLLSMICLVRPQRPGLEMGGSRHIVGIVCPHSATCIPSWTRPQGGLVIGGSRHIGIAMCPPAQCNLHSFMEEVQAQEASGCDSVEGDGNKGTSLLALGTGIKGHRCWRYHRRCRRPCRWCCCRCRRRCHQGCHCRVLSVALSFVVGVYNSRWPEMTRLGWQRNGPSIPRLAGIFPFLGCEEKAAESMT
jgi:hypothetical protein